MHDHQKITILLQTAKLKIVPKVSVREALSVQVKISNVASWSDSKIALHWVKSVIKSEKFGGESCVQDYRKCRS